MLKILIILVILNFYNSALASTKDKIISKLEQTNNLSFNFIQTINKKKITMNLIIKEYLFYQHGSLY